MGTLERPCGGRVAVAGADVGDARRPRARRPARAADRLRLPAVLPAGRDERAGERRAGDAVQRHADRRARSAARVRAGARRARAPAAPSPRPAQRRRAPARGDRAGGRGAAGDRVRRRADREPRLALGRRDHDVAARAARRGDDGRRHHPRPRPRGGAAAAACACATGAWRWTRERRPPRPGRACCPPTSLRVGAVGLRTRRLRAALSALGIAIGIASMVAVLGLSASSRAGLLSQLDALGTNLLTASPGQTLGGDDASLPRRTRKVLSRLGRRRAGRERQGAPGRDGPAHRPDRRGGVRRDRGRRRPTASCWPRFGGTMARGRFLNAATARTRSGRAGRERRRSGSASTGRACWCTSAGAGGRCSGSCGRCRWRRTSTAPR